MTRRELVTNDDPSVAACVGDTPGLHHDWRLHTYFAHWSNRQRTSFRCVWCHSVACGDPDEVDPCWEPYHHHGDHITRAGTRWPLGGDRP